MFQIQGKLLPSLANACLSNQDNTLLSSSSKEIWAKLRRSLAVKTTLWELRYEARRLWRDHKAVFQKLKRTEGGQVQIRYQKEILNCEGNWHRLPKEAVDMPSLEAFKARLYGALSNLIQYMLTLPMARGLDIEQIIEPQNKPFYNPMRISRMTRSVTSTTN